MILELCLMIGGIQQDPPPVQSTPPHPQYWLTSSVLAAGSEEEEPVVKMLASGRTDTRELSFKWWWNPLPNSPAFQSSDRSSFTARLWPTAIANSGPRTFFVAGKDLRTSACVVEKWEFVEPSYGSTTDENGSVTYRMSAGALQRPVPRIHQAPTSARGLLTNLCGDRRTSGQLLGFFEGSREIVRMDGSSGVVTVVASMNQNSQSLHIPQLAQLAYFEAIRSKKHTDHGYVLILSVTPRAVPGELLGLALFDQDLDGAFESFVAYDEETWGNLELGVSSKYE